jgi:hypothetical protein
MKKVYLTAEQIVNLRNSMIILEALNEEESATNVADSDVSGDYNRLAMTDDNRKPNDPPPDVKEKQSSSVYGDVTKVLYNYSKEYNLPSKIALEVSKADARISQPMAAHFIEKLLYGLYKMSSDATQNEAFERLMKSIGVDMNAPLLTVDDEQTQ